MKTFTASCIWEPDRYSTNQFLQTRNPDPSLRDVTPGGFSNGMPKKFSPRTDPSLKPCLCQEFRYVSLLLPASTGAMGNFNGINNFVSFAAGACWFDGNGLFTVDQMRCLSNKQIIMFAEAQIPTQFPSDNVVLKSCESNVLFSIFADIKHQDSYFRGHRYQLDYLSANQTH